MRNIKNKIDTGLNANRTGYDVLNIKVITCTLEVLFDTRHVIGTNLVKYLSEISMYYSNCIIELSAMLLICMQQMSTTNGIQEVAKSTKNSDYAYGTKPNFACFPLHIPICFTIVWYLHNSLSSKTMVLQVSLSTISTCCNSKQTQLQTTKYFVHIYQCTHAYALFFPLQLHTIPNSYKMISRLVFI